MAQHPSQPLHKPLHKPPRKPAPRSTRWTGEKAATFLKALAQCGKVAPAARSVGMSRQAAYRLKARAPKFAEMWELALEDAALRRQMERARARALHPLLAPDFPANSTSKPGDTRERGA